jgi:hypothetical protein
MTIATEAEAVNEWVHNVGYEDCYKDRQWILSSYDSWERNPYYSGHDQTHPEDDTYLCENEWIETEVEGLRNPVDFKSIHRLCTLAVDEGDPVLNEIPF